MIVKLEMLIDIDEADRDNLDVLTHHIDRLLDLDNWPEIKGVSQVKITNI